MISPATGERPFTVRQVNRLIENAFATLGGLLVEGELTQVRVAGSGHLYATLKDGDEVLGLVMWRSSLARGGVIPKEGARVVAKGALSLYAPRGSYQLVATRLTPVGQGDLLQRLEERKLRLAAEGLFAEERKRPLPELPRAVGIATAAGSAALADILEGLRRRFPAMPLYHAPCLVQGGAEAAASIVAALQRLSAQPDMDVIVLGRGGGSTEDLLVWQDESVVRAIVACPVPVICAVGHETDTCLAELAADVRAKTPTAAAELAVPEFAELQQTLQDHSTLLHTQLRERLQQAEQAWSARAAHRALARPEQWVASRRERLTAQAQRLHAGLKASVAAAHAHLAQAHERIAGHAPAARLHLSEAELQQRAGRLQHAAQSALRLHAERLHASADRLHALSPVAVLGRGYSMLQVPDGSLLRDPHQAPAGTPLLARLAQGELRLMSQGSAHESLGPG